MTNVLKEAIEKLKTCTRNNVAYALIGDSIVCHESAYCFGSMSGIFDNQEEMANHLEGLCEDAFDKTVDGVQFYNGMFLYPGCYHTMILRAKNVCPGSYNEPATGKALTDFLRCQEMLLEQFEYALHPASFEERRENGIIIDLTKITSNALGVLLVGHRNMYEHRRYETIIPLMDDHGWGFQEAFTISQFFRRGKLGNGVIWRGDHGGHCILNSNVSMNHTDQITCMLKNNLLFSFDGEPYSEQHTWWGVGSAYSKLLMANNTLQAQRVAAPPGPRQGYWPMFETGVGFNRTQYLFTGPYPEEIAQFKGILKENK